MRLSDKFEIFGIIIIVLLVFFGGYGWVENIIKLYHSTFTPLTGQIVLRAIGTFLPPVGAIMGYM